MGCPRFAADIVIHGTMKTTPPQSLRGCGRGASAKGSGADPWTAFGPRVVGLGFRALGWGRAFWEFEALAFPAPPGLPKPACGAGRVRSSSSIRPHLPRARVEGSIEDFGFGASVDAMKQDAVMLKSLDS